MTTGGNTTLGPLPVTATNWREGSLACRDTSSSSPHAHPNKGPAVTKDRPPTQPPRASAKDAAYTPLHHRCTTSEGRKGLRKVTKGETKSSSEQDFRA